MSLSKSRKPGNKEGDIRSKPASQAGRGHNDAAVTSFRYYCDRTAGPSDGAVRPAAWQSRWNPMIRDVTSHGPTTSWQTLPEPRRGAAVERREITNPMILQRPYARTVEQPPPQPTN
eukprot:762840-Hanusia_phi.AAC.1